MVSTRRAVISPAPRTALAAALVFCAIAALLAVVQTRPASHMSARAAESAALRDPIVREELPRLGYDRVRTMPLDHRLTRVSFFKGPHILVEAAVAPDGSVPHTIAYRAGSVRSGSETAQRPWVLLLLCAAFALATAAVPLRRLRNLDVLALVWFTVPVVLLNERLLEASVYASYPPLLYLAGRCLWVAFGAADAAAPAGSRPVYEWLTRGWRGGTQRRMLGIGVGASALALLLLTVPGGLVGDVAYASMAGATDVFHGTLPYGHLPTTDLVHGDTYPLLAYAAYVPAAIFMPVKTGFDNLDGALYVAAAFALVGAGALYVAARRSSLDNAAGLRLALAWLCFPPVVITASSGSNDLAAAAGVAVAAALITYPGASAVAITVAGWMKLGPLLLLPAWTLRWRSGARLRALCAAAAVTLLVALWVLALGGSSGFGDMLHALSFQAERGSLLSIWTLWGARGPQLVLQAALLTLVVLGATRIRRDRAFAGDPRRVAALAAAILLGVQIVANYWTYAYLPWVFPLIALALLCEARVREHRVASPLPTVSKGDRAVASSID